MTDKHGVTVTPGHKEAALRSRWRCLAHTSSLTDRACQLHSVLIPLNIESRYLSLLWYCDLSQTAHVDSRQLQTVQVRPNEASCALSTYISYFKLIICQPISFAMSVFLYLSFWISKQRARPWAIIISQNNIASSGIPRKNWWVTTHVYSNVYRMMFS